MATRAPKAPSSAAVGAIAPMMVGTVNLFVIESMGEQCGITDMEAKFLIPSTQRTLERIPAQAAERAAIILDPLIVIAVMGMWFKRIGDIKRAEALQKYVVGPQERARASAVSGTEYRVPDGAPEQNDQAAYAAPNYVAVETGEVPIPEHPDMTSNGVPDVIRNSFNGTL